MAHGLHRPLLTLGEACFPPAYVRLVGPYRPVEQLAVGYKARASDQRDRHWLDAAGVSYPPFSVSRLVLAQLVD